jgi:DNA-binding CsgD family transcriptional regulator
LRALVAVHRGDLGGATSLVASALEVIARNPKVERLVTTSLWYWAARAALQEATDEGRAALETLHEAQDVCRGYVPTLTAEVVRLAVAHGERKWAREHVEWVEACVPRAQTATMTGVALHARGLYEDDPDILLASAKAYVESPRPLQRAAACVDAAVALGRQGRASEATPLFETALDFYELVGATRDIARVTAAMRELGIRRGARGRRQRPTVGWDSLTKSEMDVVRLVATGLRNADVADRLFISPRTVQTHLSHVFAKLGISSRAELVAEATRRSSASPALRS